MLLNAFWVPAIASSGGKLGAVTDRDFEVFQTVAHREYGLEATVVSLYGFWGDSSQVPKDFNRLWIIYGIGTFALAIAGATILVRRRSIVALSFLGILPLTIVIALGYSHGLGSVVIDALRILPGFSGLRETAKVIGIIALFVAIFTPYAITSLYNWRPRTSLCILTLTTVVTMSGMLSWSTGTAATICIPRKLPSGRPKTR